MPQTTWFANRFVLVPIAVAVGIAIGIIFPRISRIGPGPTTSPAGMPSGVHIERVESAEELFDVVGRRALVFKYSGGDVEFWIETDAQGTKQDFHRGMIYQSAGGFDQLRTPAPGQTVEGYFLWLRGDPDGSGKEEWTTAFRRKLVSAESAGVRVSLPIVDAEVSQSKEDAQQLDGKVTDDAVQVWRGKKTDGFSGSMRISSIPSPVPTDREFCIWTITESRGKKGEDGFEEHVIRVMCKVVPSEKRSDASTRK